MKSALCIAAVALGMSAAPFAHAAIAQFNGTCPGGYEVHADDGGPVYINGREARLKRFNENYYEATDPDGTKLSITRSADTRVQMSYTQPGGANGICQVSDASTPRDDERDRPRSFRQTDEDLPTTATCESVGQQQTECDLDTRGRVQLVRQLSKTRCVEGQNWGLNRHSVWVKEGCRAEFRNASATDRSLSHDSRTNTGADLQDACDKRAGAPGVLVTRVPVNDDVTELIVDYPDGRYLCMAGNDGQVRSLTPLRRRR
ncbi:DUF3011 domain-containing protein [Stenotrophomonas sp. HITSZ_GD]|uniref:DUF3011 domain-containing protein n=1 Tax=Stenotrophomonas sp. HITSZ_GD TaxID=3037248 RepID=UPI00240DBE2C|nr:DUF3011 domain-containing protein [Stenotrophomonas sp. HITSZ_GD]MDG2526571.1 DUF3011 domain-containing protein [Stenotrophomonas sp. HITSZ_GD]